MAKAVDFREFTPRDSRDDLIRRVEHAPIEHAEAVLAGYDLLQKLHDRGVIDLFNGLLSASDTVMEHVTHAMRSKEAVTGFRVALILGSLLTSIDPEKLHTVLSETKRNDPPTLVSVLKQASSKDARRGLAAIVGLLNILGTALKPQGAKS